MFDSIAKQIDQIVLQLLPNKLLFLSMDGVCPRAKVNQQRQRRFMTALEQTHQDNNKSKLIDKFKQNDLKIPKIITEDGKNFEFDRNAISPGTTFMLTLSE